ncbi:MAG: hypothetical protein HY764_00615, partial [Candidatus Portnoybacteria bacterium]|nr:hypothetical protein [Candidatus Portnoybacteria bacterium]
MVKKVIRKVLVISGLMISLGISHAHAGVIEVSGNVSGAWSTGNTYIVTSTVTVPLGLKLTVEPGVMVKFSTNTSLIIAGELIAIGTLNGTITFTSNNTSPQQGDWNNIKF